MSLRLQPMRNVAIRWRRVSALVLGLGAMLMNGACSTRDASTGSSDDAIASLSWGLPMALSTGAGRDCDTIWIGKPELACGQSRRTPAPEAQRMLATMVASANDESPTSQRRRALADLWYAQTDTLALERAIHSLRVLADIDSLGCASKVDFASALLIRYAQQQNVIDGLEALDVSQRALGCNSQHEAAAWNVALAATWLGLRDRLHERWAPPVHTSAASTTSWRRAAWHTPEIQPADDVLTLPVSEAAASARWTEATRDFVWRSLAASWGAAIIAKDSLAASRARTALQAVVDLSADHEANDSPAALANVMDDARDVARDELARGFVAMARLRDALDRSDWASARLAVEESQRARAFAVRFDAWIAYQRANIELLSGDRTQARAMFNNVTLAYAQRAPVVVRRAKWSAALALQAEEQQSQAATELQQAADACEAANEEACTIGAAAGAGASFLLIGDEPRAAQVLGTALRRSNDVPLGNRRWSVLAQLRQVASKRGWRFATSMLDREQFAVAARINRPDLQLLSVRREVESLLTANELAAADSALRLFGDIWEHRVAPTVQDAYRADYLVLQGDLASKRRAVNASTLLDSAVHVAERAGSRVRAINMRWTRLRAHADHDTAWTLTELDALLDATYARSGAGRAVFDDVRLFETARSATETAARMLIAQGRLRSALRALSGKPFRAAAPPVRGQDNLAVRQIGDSITMWVPTIDSVRVVTASITAPALRQLIALGDSASLSLMYDALLGPWNASRTSNDSSTLIKLDVRGVGADVPWAALRNRVDGQYLVESHAIELVTGEVRRGAAVSRLHETKLIRSQALIIDAAPRDGRYRLPGAAKEAAAVQALWKTDGVLLDGESGLRALSASASPLRVVHFAGHAFADPSNPERSALMVVTARGDSLIRARDLLGLRLHNIDLLVLAACESRASGNTPNSGLESLAGVLHAAGAKQVIGASWQVDDDATTGLMLELHRGLRAGLTPSQALRAAQLTFIRSSDPTRNAPRVWAAFQLLGS